MDKHEFIKCQERAFKTTPECAKFLGCCESAVRHWRSGRREVPERVAYRMRAAERCAHRERFVWKRIVEAFIYQAEK